MVNPVPGPIDGGEPGSEHIRIRVRQVQVQFNVRALDTQAVPAQTHILLTQHPVTELVGRLHRAATGKLVILLHSLLNHIVGELPLHHGALAVAPPEHPPGNARRQHDSRGIVATKALGIDDGVTLLLGVHLPVL